ncbi:MAG TPA: AmmeMemoRadiSam system protein B [Bryobacteraceae bacterium]|nr:AmmeMemoRadiSam system protein B [Bryobacteraceae bacterium]
MSGPLPRLRLSLDFVPSPDPQHPGLLIRDPFRFSESMLLIPPQLVACLACFDGEQTALDLRASLVRLTGEIQVGDIEKHLYDTLDEAGFLENERFEQMRLARIHEFAAAPKREASHAGSAYPNDGEGARKALDEFMQGAAPPPSADSQIGIAAPHVSPFGGWECYRDAYATLLPSYRNRTFVVLGTSHYGEPDRFGLTRKPFVTPLGEATTEVKLVDELERRAPAAVRMEDYCHAVEHSIEFQILFLQHIYGPEVRILPILCGAFARSIHQGGKPEAGEPVRQFFETLGDIAAREGHGLFWVLGVDLAHMGRRYGDQLAARAEEGQMSAVAERDRSRIERLNEADADGFWALVQENQDDLKWCGSAPLYTFLKAAPQARGTLHRYQQWNIDEQSVVSFAAMGFRSS